MYISDIVCDGEYVHVCVEALLFFGRTSHNFLLVGSTPFWSAQPPFGQLTQLPHNLLLVGFASNIRIKIFIAHD